MAPKDVSPTVVIYGDGIYLEAQLDTLVSQYQLCLQSGGFGGVGGNKHIGFDGDPSPPIGDFVLANTGPVGPIGPVGPFEERHANVTPVCNFVPYDPCSPCGPCIPIIPWIPCGPGHP